MPPDVTWLGALAGDGAWLGTEMDPPLFCAEEPPLVPLLAEPPPPVLVPLLLLVPLLGDVVAWAG